MEQLWLTYEEGQQAGDLDMAEQDLHYGALLHYHVHVDSSYPKQGWAKVEIWNADTTSWNVVATLPGSYCTNGDYRRKREDAMEAVDMLRANAMRIYQ